MTDCNLEPIRFPSCKGRLVEASFPGGAITSDGGAVVDRYAPQGQLPAFAIYDGPAAGVRAGAGIRRPERPRRTAVGPGAANGGGRRRAAGRRFHPVPFRARDGPGRGGAPARCAGGTVCRILREPAAPSGAGLRRHRRSGARHAGRSFLPRVLRPPLLSAPVRVLRRPAAGGLAAPGQQRRRPARPGDSGPVDETAAPAPAEGEDSSPRRRRIPPSPHAVVARAQRRRLRRRRRGVDGTPTGGSRGLGLSSCELQRRRLSCSKNTR